VIPGHRIRAARLPDESRNGRKEVNGDDLVLCFKALPVYA
jgi:hypothetical protein